MVLLKSYVPNINRVYVFMCIHTHTHTGFPGGASGKEPTSKCRRPKITLEEGMGTYCSILA